MKLSKLKPILIIFVIGYGISFTNLWSPIRLLFLPLLPVFTYIISYYTLDVFYKGHSNHKISLTMTIMTLIAFFSLERILNQMAYDITKEENLPKFIYLYIENQFHLLFFIFSFLMAIIETLVLNKCMKIKGDQNKYEQ